MRAEVSASAGTAHKSEWTPARTFMAVSFVYHLVLGIAGFLVDQTFPIGPDAAKKAGSGIAFGTFETNGWHSLAAIGVAAVSLYFLLRPGRAREGALGIGGFHVGLVIALIVWPPETFWIASNTADQFVHTFTALAGIASGLLTPRREAAG